MTLALPCDPDRVQKPGAPPFAAFAKGGNEYRARLKFFARASLRFFPESQRRAFCEQLRAGLRRKEESLVDPAACG